MTRRPSTGEGQPWPVKLMELCLERAHARLDAWGVPRPDPADSTDAWQAFRADDRRTA